MVLFQANTGGIDRPTRTNKPRSPFDHGHVMRCVFLIAAVLLLNPALPALIS